MNNSKIDPAVLLKSPYRSYFNAAFVLLIVYCWVVRFTQGDSAEIISGEVAYYFYVVPSAIFGIFGAIAIMFNRNKLEQASKFMLIFGITVAVTSVLRGDIKSALTFGMMAANLAVIFQFKPLIKLKLINILFILSIFINTVLFFIGFSIYTFVPGLNAHPNLFWRVSAYPSVAEGALFALFVFVANSASQPSRMRLPMCLISGYMLLLSGIRTAIIAGIICLLYITLCRTGALRTGFSRRMFFISVIALFLSGIFLSEYILLTPMADSAILQALIFRDMGGAGLNANGEFATAATREWIMSQHLAAFTANPLLGIGTFDLAMLTSGYGALDNAGVNGSEAFITYILARIGLLSIPFFVVLFFLNQTLRNKNEILSNSCRISLMISMISYGSFVNVYDIVFLLFILGIAGGVNEGGVSVVPQRRRKEAGRVRDALVAKF